MSSAWDEIKRLASDLQRAQLSSVQQKLSDRNCVEIVTKLLELNLLKVFFTNDGKEYITPEHLDTEILDDLYHNGGRVKLVTLASSLDIDIDIITERVEGLSKSGDLYFVSEQIISEEYLNKIAEEINEKLMNSEILSIDSIASSYNLLTNFIELVISKHIGKTIQGHEDPFDGKSIYTDNFIENHNGRVRGVLAAIIEPVPVVFLLNKFRMKDHLFYQCADSLIASGRISGCFTEREFNASIYTPTVFLKAQYNMVENQLSQNGYLEFSNMLLIGIKEPEDYAREHFAARDLTFVSGFCFAPYFVDHINTSIDEALAQGGLVDLAVFLPSTLPSSTCQELIQRSLERHETSQSRGSRSTPNENHVIGDSVVVSHRLVTQISTRLEEAMPARAKSMVEAGQYEPPNKEAKIQSSIDDSGPSLSKKEERRRRAAAGKQGGGTQGRESKTRSTKGKKDTKRRKDDDDEDEETGESATVVYMKEEELCAEVAKESEFEECVEELLQEMAVLLAPQLNEKFKAILRQQYAALKAGGGDSRRKTHMQMQEKVTALLTTIKLAHKGIKEFSDETQSLLCKYLLRSECSELLNDVVLYLAQDQGLKVKEAVDLTLEARLKLINSLDDDSRGPILALNKTVSGTELEPFLDAVDDAFMIAEILLKKKDNKKDRQLLVTHRASLVDQLTSCATPALALHVSCLLLFQAVSGHMLLASGKFVPQILLYVKLQLPQDFYEQLHEFQVLVLQVLTKKSADGDCDSEGRLEDLLGPLKEAVVAFKKGGDAVDKD